MFLLLIIITISLILFSIKKNTLMIYLSLIITTSTISFWRGAVAWEAWENGVKLNVVEEYSSSVFAVITLVLILKYLFEVFKYYKEKNLVNSGK